MSEASVPAIKAPPVKRDNPLTRSVAGIVGMVFLAVMFIACVATLPWTIIERPIDGTEVLQEAQQRKSAPYDHQVREARHLPPFWAPAWGGPGGRPPRPGSPEWKALAERKQWTDTDERARAVVAKRYWDTALYSARVQMARDRRVPVESLIADNVMPTPEQIESAQPTYWLGTDLFGRSLLIRCLVGGGISLGVGIAAAAISVVLGTLWGTLAGWIGGRFDGFMMRIVDVLYGLPYILLVVLLAVAGDAVIREYDTRERERLAWVKALQAEVAGVDAAMKVLEEAAAARPGPPSIEELEIKREAIVAESNARAATDVGGLAARVDAMLRQSWAGREADGPPGGAGTPPAAGDLIRGKTVKQVTEELGGLVIHGRNLSGSMRQLYELLVLLVAIGGVSWLTMARVVRGQVLSLKNQPFIEATRAIGVPWHGVFTRHLLPNLMGPITVYATLTVPQAILQESFLSFLGIGVRPPLPSWGNLAAEGLPELNIVDSKWWLLLFPCLLLASTLLALNFVGEGLREAMDPRRSRR